MYLVALKQKTKKQSKNQTSRQFAVHARNRYTGILGAMFRGLLGEEESSWSDEPLEAFTSAAARVALMLLWDTKKLYLPRIMLTAVFGVLILWKETRAVHTRK